MGYALSLADYIKGLNFTISGFDLSHLRIPENNRTIAEFMFLYTCSGFPADFQPVVDENYQLANIKVDLKDHRAATIRRVLEATREWIKRFHRTPRAEFYYPGGEIGVQAAVNEIVSSLLPRNILQVAGLVFICVSLAYGSLAAGGMLLLPLALSLIFTFGVLGFSGLGLTVETLPVAALGIGLGVDYGIYVISRLRGEFVLRRNIELRAALARSLKSSGKAVFFTGITVAVSVFSWTLSPLRLQARLGLVLGTLLLLNVVGALVLLPCLITSIKPRFIFKRKCW